MDLVRWTDDMLDPVGTLDRLQRDINRLFDLPARPTETRGLFDRTVSPAVDMVETGEGFMVIVDLPGIDPGAVDVTIASNVLTVKGERKLPREQGRVLRRESWEGTFQRTLSLSATVDPEHVEASYRNGILEIRLSKKEEARPKKITVKAR